MNIFEHHLSEIRNILSLSLYFSQNGIVVAQEMHYMLLLNWKIRVDFIWGIEDVIFTEDWGREWSKRMNGSFTPIVGANHFLQNTHAEEIVKTILN